jgi:RimJ/RimL family protein N-acetyltransferase
MPDSETENGPGGERDVEAGPARRPSPQPITFRPLTRADFPLLCRWLNAPHVRAWWRGEEPAPETVEREYGPQLDGADPSRCFVFHVRAVPVGMIQCYRHGDSPEWDRVIGIPGAAGIDYLIGEADRCGQGIGTAAISAFTSVVFDLYPEVSVIVSAPQRDNRASCRALEKAGFTLGYEGMLDSDDPSDSGVAAVYVLHRSV